MTKKRTAPAFDRAFAKVVFDRTSAYCVDHPDARFTKWLVGDNPTAWWRSSPTHADDVPGWKIFEQDDNANFRRATFTKGVRLVVSDFYMARALAALENEYGGQAVPAAAFRVGKALVAAEIPEYNGNQIIPPAEVRHKEAAILGIGYGSLHATLGAFHLESGEFIGAQNVTAGEVMPLQDLAILYPNTPKL